MKFGLDKEWPVVIVGAGPVGMSLANLLAKCFNAGCIVSVATPQEDGTSFFNAHYSASKGGFELG